MGGRGSNNLRNLTSIRSVESVNPKSYKGYAKELAKLANDRKNYDDELLVLSSGKNESFALVQHDNKTDYITYLGSTGGRTGTQLFTQLLQKSLKEGKSVNWEATNEKSEGFYTYLGLEKYGTWNRGTTTYSISSKDLKFEIERLLRRKR